MQWLVTASQVKDKNGEVGDNDAGCSDGNMHRASRCVGPWDQTAHFEFLP